MEGFLILRCNYSCVRNGVMARSRENKNVKCKTTNRPACFRRCDCSLCIFFPKCSRPASRSFMDRSRTIRDGTKVVILFLVSILYTIIWELLSCRTPCSYKAQVSVLPRTTCAAPVPLPRSMIPEFYPNRTTTWIIALRRTEVRILELRPCHAHHFPGSTAQIKAPLTVVTDSLFLAKVTT